MFAALQRRAGTKGREGKEATPCGQCARSGPCACQAERDPLAGLEGRGQPLPEPLRQELEPRFRHDFSNVRIHADARAGESADSFDALAYTYGRDVVFGPGQFDPASARGRRLIAHELTHVVQQSAAPRPSVQRQGKGGPLDLQPDVCVTVPVLGQACGSDAAKVCSEVNLPGCGAVCKAFDCKKPKEPKVVCPSGWRAAGSKGFEGQCCQGSVDNEASCCPPQRIGFFDGRCCRSDEVVSENRCKKASDLPPLPGNVLCPFPGQRSVLGDKCCFPPEVPQGLSCGVPTVIPPKPPPKPPPVVPQATEIFFRLDRPFPGESASSLSSATTAKGKANFDALVKSMKQDPTLVVQLIGRASPEGTEEYNEALGERRARMVAAALKSAGIPESRLADPSESDLRSECKAVATGLHTCGEAGATGATDQQVLARVFARPVP